MLKKKAYLQFVRWIFDGGNDLSFLSHIDESELYKFIKLHRLTSFIHERLTNNSTSQFTLDFKNKIDEDFRWLVSDTNDKIRFIIELNKYYPHHTPLPIKGVVPFLLTNDEKMIKYSGDLDILYDDPKALMKCCEKLGGNILNESCSAHEDFKCTFPNLYIEGHNSFPMIRLPSNLSEKHDKISSITQFPLKYDDLLKNSFMCGDILLPSIEMSILVISAHIYKDFYWEPYALPRIRLFDLYTVNYLAKSSSFSQVKFMDILEKYGAKEIILFINECLKCYTVSSSFQWIENEKATRLYFKLMNAVNSLYIPIEDSVDIAMLPMQEFDDIIQSLRPNVVSLNQYYSSSNVDGYYSEGASEKAYFEFTIRRADDDLRITVKLDRMGWKSSFFVALDNNFAHIHFEKIDIKKEFGLFNSAEFDFNICTFNPILNFKFPLLSESKSLIMIWEKEEGKKLYQTVIPIRIE